MENVKTYIQQIRKNGNSYTKGEVVDILEEYNIICPNFPFVLLPEPKELPKRDWPDEHGIDVFVPSTRLIKEYDIDVEFLYVGTEQNIRTDVGDFIDFLYGRNENAVGSLLAVYNEYTEIGRKDIIVTEIENNMYYTKNGDSDSVAAFKVKFMVCDPVTDVILTQTTNNGNTTLALNF